MALQPGNCDRDECEPLTCETDSLTVCVPGMAAMIGPVGATGATGPSGPPGSGSQSDFGEFVPTYINDGEIFLVPENRQALFSVPIISDGFIAVDGVLIEVT